MEIVLKEARIGLAAWRYGLSGPFEGVMQIAAEQIDLPAGDHQARGRFLAWVRRGREFPVPLPGPRKRT